MLAVRTVRFYVRNPELVLAKLFTYIFMGCFMGAHAAHCCGHHLPLCGERSCRNAAAASRVR